MLCVLCGSESKQLLFPYTVLTDWYLQLRRSVYCAVRTGYLNTIQVMCFVWFWEQTAIISLYSINWLVFITETECLLRGTDWIFKYNSGYTQSQSSICCQLHDSSGKQCAALATQRNLGQPRRIRITFLSFSLSLLIYRIQRLSGDEQNFIQTTEKCTV